MRKSALATLAVLTLGALTLAADEDFWPKWAKSTASGPPARAGQAAAWNTQKGTMLLYSGGVWKGLTVKFFGDMWEFDPKGGWTDLAATKASVWPAPRGGHAAAWDPTHNVMWLFGGVGGDGVPRNDLWKFDPVGPTWTEVACPGDKPEGRIDFCFAYDPKGDQLIVHGGASGRTARDHAFSDLWLFDVAKGTWTSKATTARPRSQAASAFDPEAGLLWVHGGRDARGLPKNDLVTYSVKDDKWTDLGTGPVKGRVTAAHQGVWDAKKGVFIIHSGTRPDEEVVSDDLWSYDPKDGSKYKWTKLKIEGMVAGQPAPGPGNRAFHSTLWNPADRTLYVFGGTANQYDDPVVAPDVWSIKLKE